MGGFIYNGMGWKEVFQPIKTVGSFYCAACRSVQNIAVMEVESKVAVFRIPTVTFKIKYAVGCEKCKNGFYIEEADARRRCWRDVPNWWNMTAAAQR